MLAFDAKSQGSVSGSSLTFSHTCSGVDRILVVAVSANGSTGDQITGVTYNGVAMTRAKVQQLDTQGIFTYFYILVASATGANNVVISASGSFVIRGVSVSYTGASQTGQPDAVHSNAAWANPGTSVSADVTVVAANCWLLGAVQNDSANAMTPSGDLTTSRGHDGANVLTFGDSNGAVAPGVRSASWTSASQKLAAVGMSIAEKAEAAGGNFIPFL